MSRIKQVLTANFCAILLACFSQTAFAIVVPIASIDGLHASLSPDIPEPVRKQIETALKSENCRFVKGSWTNARINLRFAGDTSAINELLNKLAKCPAITVPVSFKAMKGDWDWMVVNDTRRSGEKFNVIINLDYAGLQLEDLVIPASKISGATPTSYSHWNGDWEVADDLHTALGFAADSRALSFTYPSSFRLSLGVRATNAADSNDGSAGRLEEMGHGISNSGRWIADAEELGFTTDRCIVSTHLGNTFLWFTDVPFVGIHGGKVSYVEGVDKNHDLLIIDYNTMPKHLDGEKRTGETIVYRRKKQ
ncbi:hypothetical protein Poly51_17740 [Rubripirellula tenax]|uniref:Uncharacterized protein n=1 Tax=Rubripirellula tenax TaxID=2528015 RepID=A0A5C6FAZ5_9BACT|nr:hypothetical protein [Rubripirellula tenax]TWU58993.1 hypothetical protein Poly51_17740 [Rubripirellula tenax]